MPLMVHFFSRLPSELKISDDNGTISIEITIKL